MKFEWDQKKAQRNLKKHGISFAEAVTVFNDLLSMTINDPDHSDQEERLILMGESNQRRLLIVSYTERGDRVRIISARPATKVEREVYEEGN